MIVKSILPFIAIGFFLLALIFRHKPLLKRKRFRKEPISFFEEVLFSEGSFGKVAGALGWLSFAIYCYAEVSYYLTEDEYFDASVALVFLAFSLLLAALMMKPKTVVNGKGDDDLFFTITKIALIAAVFYFPFSEIPTLERLLIYLTTTITATVLNLFNVGVYTVYPSSIYTTNSSFHELYRYTPIEIILACTAIQSMVLFTGLVFGVKAPLKRKLEAFFVSVPTIYLLNIVRNVFVAAAYFEQWFGPPLQSFYVAHGIIA
ncbi:MAG: archaeosortase A, partial [Methanophagales archaeon]|nr:archaeosortase A [Methanophagales archaeon]